MSKDELLTMVKFGANEILAMGGSSITDEDIDLILQRGKGGFGCGQGLGLECLWLINIRKELDDCLETETFIWRT